MVLTDRGYKWHGSSCWNGVGEVNREVFFKNNTFAEMLMSTIYVLTSINLRCLLCRHYTYINISFEMLDCKALEVLIDICLHSFFMGVLTR